MYDSLKNKIVLITGSTSGIGRQMARQLCEDGATVIINYAHNEEQAKDTEKEFNEKNYKFDIMKADISNTDDVEKVMNEIKNKYGKLDFLVNNAATDYMESIEEFDIEHLKKEIEVNLIARFVLIQKAIPLLKKSNNPKIINIASRLAERPMLDSSAYCVAEAGTVMLTKVSALELAKYNIKVNTVSPSMTLTPLALQSYTNEDIEEMSRKNPSKRLGTPEDTANLVCFLLSDKADYINGENLNVNGGILLV